MRRVMAAFVQDKDVEVDNISSTHTKGAMDEVKVVVNEPDMFKEGVDLARQTKVMKNKAYRLKKRYMEGKSGVQSKYLDSELVNGYGLFDVVEPPYNLEVLASLFEENAIHNAAVLARTMNTVGLGYQWEDTTASRKRIERATGKENSLQRLRDELQKEEDKLNQLFDDFNIDDTFTDTLIKVWIDYLTMGNGYIEVGRNKNGSIGYVGHIPAACVRVRRARDGYVQRSSTKYVYFRNFQDLKTADPINQDPNPNEIIHLKQYTPTNTYYGVPSAVSAISAIIGDKFAKEYNIDYFENKSIPRYAIILKGANLSQKSKNEVINYFRNEIKGNSHGTLFVPLPATLGRDVDIKFEALENTTQDGSFDKYRKSNRDEITVANRTPAPKLGIYDNANLAVSRDADKTFKNQVVAPDQKSIEKRVNRIVSEFSSAKKFKFAEIDLIDDDIRSRIWDRYLRTEVITPNEVRQKIGLTAREGGDDPLPYATKVQQEKNESDAKLAEKQAKQVANSGGGQVGNSNAEAGSPPKAQHDAANKPSSSADATTGRQERGAAQDGSPPR